MRSGAARAGIPLLVLVALSLSCARLPLGPIPCDPERAPRAFPTAEGAGAGARGGRCGDVYTVTTLLDSGPGSLRHGIETATGPRTIVFATAGTLWLERPLRIDRPHLTLAGQTAPGEGITVAGRPVYLRDTHDLIVRYLRFRPGPGPAGSEPDALGVARCTDVMIDHVSASWAVDEILPVTHDSHRVTVQWSFVTEALHQAGHHKGNHGYGTLIDGGDITFHHVLFAHNRSRNPRPGGRAGRTRAFFVNNVIHNPGTRFGYAGTESFDLFYVGNTGLVGPDTEPELGELFSAGGPGNRIHRADNWLDTTPDGVVEASPAGDTAFGGDYTPISAVPLGVAVEPAQRALEHILARAGASRRRDAVDRRVVASVRRQDGYFLDTPTEVGGWPPLDPGEPWQDADGDGMPDEWERRNGLDPEDPRDRHADPEGDGWTRLEEYLEHRARPEASRPDPEAQARANPS